MKSLYYWIQTNRQLDKCGLFAVPWMDLHGPFGTEEDARNVMRDTHTIGYTRWNELLPKYTHPIEQRNLRVIRRETTDTPL